MPDQPGATSAVAAVPDGPAPAEPPLGPPAAERDSESPAVELQVAAAGDAAASVVAPAGAAAAPSDAPARIATEGRLVVLSEPAGANVTVNGVGHGATPATIRYLPFGEQRVRVTLSGYRSEERVVRLGSAQPDTTIRIALRERD